MFVLALLEAFLASNDHLQSSHIDWSQHGRRNALLASLLQAAQRSLTGISSMINDLIGESVRS